jgi:hypothetical protein
MSVPVLSEYHTYGLLYMEQEVWDWEQMNTV